MLVYNKIDSRASQINGVYDFVESKKQIIFYSKYFKKIVGYSASHVWMLLRLCKYI